MQKHNQGENQNYKPNQHISLNHLLSGSPTPTHLPIQPHHTFFPSPHPLLFSGDFYFMTSPSSLPPQELSISFSFQRVLISHQQETHFQNEPPLPSPKSLISPILSFFFPRILPFKLSCPICSSPGTVPSGTLTPSPSCPFQDSPLPRIPPLPCRDSLPGPSDPFWDSHLQVPSAPSSLPLQGLPSWALTSSLCLLSDALFSVLLSVSLAL